MSDAPIEPTLLTPQQAAEYLTVSPRTLKRLQASGEIPHVRIGRSVRFKRTDLDRFIAANTFGAPIVSASDLDTFK